MLFRADLAMDLGTANTLIFRRGEGIVLDEPSVVLLEQSSEKVLAIGSNARRCLGRTSPDALAIRPLRDGVIADFEVTQLMIGWFVRKAMLKKHFLKPSIVIGVPVGITQVEKRAVTEAALLVGAKKVRLVEEPMAAAIGANLPISRAEGTIIVDIGGGTTEIAVISLSSIVVSKSIKVAGDEMNAAIQRYVHEKHKVFIGEVMSENIKCTIGSAFSTDSSSLKVTGKCIVEGTPKTLDLHAQEISEPLQKPLMTIIQAVLEVLGKTPPSLATDIADSGLYLTGGGALLKGLDRFISQRTSLRVLVDNDPLSTVVRGAGLIMNNQKKFESVFIN